MLGIALAPIGFVYAGFVLQGADRSHNLSVTQVIGHAHIEKRFKVKAL